MVDINIYTDPGVYISEVIEPGSVSVTSERSMVIVGIAPRTKTASDEAVVRGKVYNESLTVAATSPHIAKLINISDRNKSNAILYLNDNGLGVADWSVVPAYLTGNAVAGGVVDTSINKKFTNALDGKKPITISLTSGVGTLLTTIATDINTALAASPIYGAAYDTVANVALNILTLTSPSTTSLSDVKVILSYEDIAATYADAASSISNGAWVPSAAVGVQADTWIRINDSVYVTGVTYTIEYVAVNLVVDKLNKATALTPLSSIVYAGSYPGAISYTKNYDYEETGNTIDWDTTSWSQAVITSSVVGPYNITVGVNDKLLFSVNGLTQILVTLTPGVARTAAQVAEDINLALNASTVYGPMFAHVAADGGAGQIQLVAPNPFENYPVEHGYASLIDFYDTTTNSFNTLFGAGITFPYEIRGTGNRPTFGNVYYSTYEYVRPTSDYNNPQRFYSPDQMYAFTSPLTINNYVRNHLAIAGEIAFENYAPSVWLTQINDSIVPGPPTINQIHDAIDACAEKKGMTEVVVLDTSLDTTV